MKKHFILLKICCVWQIQLDGCAGFRLNLLEHVSLVRKHFPNHCIIGIWKKESEGSHVYITPDVDSIITLREAGVI